MSSLATSAASAWLFADPLSEYLVDAHGARSCFWHVMRRRSNDYYEHNTMAVPHVLRLDAELILDARTFEIPANYLLARIQPLAGTPGGTCAIKAWNKSS